MSIKVVLSESEIPRQWYNLAVDLPTPLGPPLGTNFSRRNEVQPEPPVPAVTRILARSMKVM